MMCYLDTHMVSELSARCIKRLDQCGCMANKKCIAGGSSQHTGDRQPGISHVARRKLAIADAQHV